MIVRKFSDSEASRLDDRPRRGDAGHIAPGGRYHGNCGLRRQPVRRGKYLSRGQDPTCSVLSGALLQRADLAGVPGRPPGCRRTDAQPGWWHRLRLGRRGDWQRPLLHGHAQYRHSDHVPCRQHAPEHPAHHDLGRGERFFERRSERPHDSRQQPGQRDHHTGQRGRASSSWCPISPCSGTFPRPANHRQARRLELTSH